MHKPSKLQLFIAQFLTLCVGLVHAAPPTSCSQTPFPEVCIHFLDAAVMLEETKLSFRDLSLKVTMDQAIRAHHLVSTKEFGSFDERAKLAWTDCQELYEDSVHQLNRSMSSTDPVDSQTWLSAATANHQTCQNGFRDFNISSYYLPSMLGNFSKLVSNSLAINKAFAASAAGLRSVNSDSKARRLLSDGFPEWVSSADRKLLRTVEAAVEADLVVAQDGSGGFKTITDALDAATKMRSGSKRFVIYVKKGVYKENIQVKKTMRNIMFVGDGIGATVVTASKNQQDGSTTFRSATFGKVL